MRRPFPAGGRLGAGHRTAIEFRAVPLPYEDEHFLSVLDDLDALVASKDGYHVVRISLLLRQLLLDGHPLVDTVNRRYRVPKLTFEICKPDMTHVQSMIWSWVEGLDPEKNRGLPRSAVNREAFLSTPYMVAHGHQYSVRDVIHYSAVLDGGSHIDPNPDDPKEEAFRSFRDSKIFPLRFAQGLPISHQPLKVIGTVVLRAVQPLRAAVLAAL